VVHNLRMEDVLANDPEASLRRIRAVVAALHRGEVVTYGLVAARAGLPGRARLVGRALRTTPDDAPLPWHRVVGAGGRIVFPPGSPAAQEQAQRLRAEGVEVIGVRVRLRIPADLDALLWGFPAAAKMPRKPKGGYL
jgi:methylated-DNA-protein-cysteine methyltransferase related protein